METSYSLGSHEHRVVENLGRFHDRFYCRPLGISPLVADHFTDVLQDTDKSQSLILHKVALWIVRQLFHELYSRLCMDWGARQKLGILVCQVEYSIIGQIPQNKLFWDWW